MWFLFGFVTLAMACVSSFLWRRMASWSGESGLADGVPFEFRVSTSKGRVTGAQVGLTCADGFTFSLRRENTFDSWSKGIGLVRECQTGDLAFDKDIYVLSDDPVVHRLLQTDKALRAGIERVFDDCATGLGKPGSLYVHGGRIWIAATPTSKKRDAATEACRSVVAALKEVATRLNSGGVGLKDDRDPFLLRAACILAISTGLSINAGIEIFRLWGGDFPMLDDWTGPLPLALAIGLTIMFGLAAVALRVMGHSARTHLVLLELLLSGTFGATVSAYAELRDYNFEYDRGAPREIPATIGAHYTTHSRKGGTHYHLTIEGWPAGGSATIEVASSTFNRTESGQSVAVEEHPGALGWSWASGFRSF
jgi:hypothetical protein